MNLKIKMNACNGYVVVWLISCAFRFFNTSCRTSMRSHMSSPMLMLTKDG